MSLTFVFPGQGSQSVGMLADLAESYPVIKETFIEASEALDVDLWALSQTGPEALLYRTDMTQPALLAASVAIWRTWQSQGGAQPALMAGHSLGEYSALACAGTITLADAVRLVNRRGELMQTAVPAGVGAMAAILGLDDDTVKAVCQQAEQGQVVAAVNFNSEGQVVIAGHAQAVDRAIELCKEAGAKRALPLSVSVPSHCILMKPAAEALEETLAAIEFSMPQIPVVQNVDARVAANLDELKGKLIQQLYCPVLWVDCVQAMVKEGATTMLECGPGKVLSGLNKRIERSLTVASLGDAAGFQGQIEQ